jgi:Carboxypeptidase regulatory-like domain
MRKAIGYSSLVFLAITLTVGTQHLVAQQTAAKPAAKAARAEAAATTELPVTRVSLYKNGVGFFEHAGRVTGDQSVTIDFTTAQLNDVLQSLTAIDLNGGRIAGAGYNSTTPLEEQLKALPLALGEDATAVDFYEAIRGARVEVHGPGETISGRLLNIELVNTPEGDNKPALEKRLITVIGEGGEVRTVELTSATTVTLLDADLHQDVTRYLQLLASTRNQGLRHLTLQDNGTGTRELRVSYIREVPIWKSTYRILFTEPKAASAAANDSTASTKQTATLQGWSVVDNTTGADWINVQLSLIAGAPQSFIQPLSVPYYSRRPEIGLPQEAQLTPQTHESGEITAAKATGIGSGSGSGMGGGVAGGFFASIASGPGITGRVTDPSGAVVANAQVTATNTDTGVQTTRTTNSAGVYSISPLPVGTYNVEVVARGFQRLLQENVNVSNGSMSGLNLRLNIGSASQTVTVTDAPPYMNTTAGTLGGTIANQLYSSLPLSMNGPPPQAYEQSAEDSVKAKTTTAAFDDYFAYNLTEPITIRKNESALVPILQTKIDAERVTLWSQQQPTPLRALWITNTSKLTLDRGSFSIVEDGNFGGEGLMEPIHPDERRLLSYAVDQAVRVNTEEQNSNMHATEVTASKGVMMVHHTQTAEITYVVHNAATDGRTVVIEHPIRQGFVLDNGSDNKDPKPDETTPTVYRFRVTAAAGETARLHVGEHHKSTASYQLTNFNDNQLTFILNQTNNSEKIKQALQPILDARRHVAEMQEALDKVNSRLDALRSDEERQRANVTALASADKASRERFVHDLNATEDQIAGAQKDLTAAQKDLQAAKDDLASKIESLQIDEKL